MMIFAELKIGDRFRFPNGTTAYRKIGQNHYRPYNKGGGARADSTKEVVPLSDEWRFSELSVGTKFRFDVNGPLTTKLDFIRYRYIAGSPEAQSLQHCSNNPIVYPIFEEEPVTNPTQGSTLTLDEINNVHREFNWDNYEEVAHKAGTSSRQCPPSVAHDAAFQRAKLVKNAVQCLRECFANTFALRKTMQTRCVFVPSYNDIASQSVVEEACAILRKTDGIVAIFVSTCVHTKSGSAGSGGPHHSYLIDVWLTEAAYAWSQQQAESVKRATQQRYEEEQAARENAQRIEQEQNAARALELKNEIDANRAKRAKHRRNFVKVTSYISAMLTGAFATAMARDYVQPYADMLMEFIRTTIANAP